MTQTRLALTAHPCFLLPHLADSGLCSGSPAQQERLKVSERRERQHLIEVVPEEVGGGRRSGRTGGRSLT